MADAKITALTELTAPTGDDLLAIVDDPAGTPVTKKIQLSNLRFGVIPSTWAVASTHVLTGSTAMGTVTGLSFSVSSGSMYRFEFVGAWQTTSSAAGVGMSINAPAAPTALVWERTISTGLGAPSVIIGNAILGSSAVVPQSSAANVDGYFYLGGICRTGANAGTLALTFGTETAGTTVSVRAGSIGFLFGPL